ncbi:hypothetical protein LSAT2_026468 [Lamellibrachia satsuma]|nr:hypothetical protein LSAT2_026468 [Lamellibrachia satsuma]
MAKGAGHGEGGGEGGGQTTGENVAIGSGVAIVFTVIMCVCGVPMIIAGAVLVQISVFRTVGIALLAVSAILTVAAIVLIILICTGCFRSESNVQPVVVAVTAGQPIATTYTSGQVVVGGPVVAPPPFEQTGSIPPPYVSPEQPPHIPHPPPDTCPAPPPVAAQ